MDTVPIVDFMASPLTILQGQVIQFRYTGSGGNPPFFYEWDFGDGTPTVSGTLTPDHVYADDGTYTVTGATGPEGEELPAIDGLWMNVNVKADGRWYISSSRPMIPVEAPEPPEEG